MHRIWLNCHSNCLLKYISHMWHSLNWLKSEIWIFKIGANFYMTSKIKFHDLRLKVIDTSSWYKIDSLFIATSIYYHYFIFSEQSYNFKVNTYVVCSIGWWGNYLYSIDKGRQLYQISLPLIVYYAIINKLNERIYWDFLMNTIATHTHLRQELMPNQQAGVKA